MALIAVVGKGMIRTKGISSKIFAALAKKDIKVRMIIQGSNELSIIIGVENVDFENAIRAIYKAFNENNSKPIGVPAFWVCYCFDFAIYRYLKSYSMFEEYSTVFQKKNI